MSSLFSVQVEVATGRCHGVTVTGEPVAMSLEEAMALLGAARREGDVVCVRFGRHFDTYYLRMPNRYPGMLEAIRAWVSETLRGGVCHAGQLVSPLAVL